MWFSEVELGMGMYGKLKESSGSDERGSGGK